MQVTKGPGARGALFVPTGHADLDRLRKDGISTWCPWYKSVSAGAAAGLTLVVAVPVLYLVFALFASGVAAVQFDATAARAELLDSLSLAAAYARYAWLSGIALALAGAAYALLHRWTVANGRYFRLGPWEMGFDTLFAAVVGYAAFSVAASAWEPLRVVHAWLFWAWGPVFAWVLARLQESYVLWMVRPDWSLAVESAVRVLMPRRFGCSAEELRIVVDDQAHAVTVYAAMDAGEAARARELIQAIPETRSVTVSPPESAQGPLQSVQMQAAVKASAVMTGAGTDAVTGPGAGVAAESAAVADDGSVTGGAADAEHPGAAGHGADAFDRAAREPNVSSRGPSSPGSGTMLNGNGVARAGRG